MLDTLDGNRLQTEMGISRSKAVHIQDRIDIVLEKLTRIYQVVYGKSMEKLILYGSYARGDYNEQSDIDVVALVHGDRLELQNQLKQIWDASSDLELQYNVILSPAVVPCDEFEQYKEDLPYYRNIYMEGVELNV